MAVELALKLPSAMNPFGLARAAFRNNPAASSGNPMAAWPARIPRWCARYCAAS